MFLRDPIFFLLFFLLFFSPHITFIIFSIISYKRWKAKKTSAWAAAMISSTLATITLIGLSVLPTYCTLTGLDDPFFFTPLISMLFLGLPVALGILVIGWPLIILFSVIYAKNRHTKSTVKKSQRDVAIIILLLVIISLALYLYRNSVIQKAESLETAPEVLTELSHHRRPEVRATVAENPNTPQEILYQFFEEKTLIGSRTYAESLINNPKTPPEILRQLYEELDTGHWLIYHIAENPNTPEDILRELANKPRSEQAGYIIGLARNPNLPADLVSKLKSDPSESIREAVNEVHGE